MSEATPVLDDDTAASPEAALKMLVDSPGFAIFLNHVRSEWGPAALQRRMKVLLQEMPASEHSAGIQSLLGTQESILKLFAWPEEEVQRLSVHTPKAPADVYESHRRIRA